MIAATAADRHRRPPAVLAGLVVAFGLALLGCSQEVESSAPTTVETTVPPETTTTTEVPIGAGKQVFVWVPEPGDCWEKRKPNPAKTDEVVLELDCNLPHANEIFGIVELKDKDFPGDQILKALAMKECPKQFKPYVGAPYETSKWEIGYHYPAATTWKESNKHVIGCYLHDKSGKKLVGSKKASAQ